MAALVILVAAVFGNGYHLQKKYDYCKSIKFEGKYCKFQKKMSKYERE